MRAERLFQRYYFSRPWYVSGTARFHELIRSHHTHGALTLEIGAGPSNSTSDYLATLGTLYGLDIDTDVCSNKALTEARTFDGATFPFSTEVFGLCVSNYVLEHVHNPKMHFLEVSRVLKPGGFYVFRTPNIWHPITTASRLLPHAIHLAVANRARGFSVDAHDPYPTVYRANSMTAIRRLASEAGLLVDKLMMIEPEPSYGAGHPALFFPLMAYERLVNMSSLLARFRVNILGVLQKVPRSGHA